MVQHDKFQQALMHIFMILLVLSCVLPFLLMVMASFTEDADVIRKEFQSLKDIFDYLQPYQLPNCHFQQLSMGMSGDYKIAIECGSTIVRIGSSIFGGR